MLSPLVELPDPGKRRTFTTECKIRLTVEADAAQSTGGVEALLRREGL